MASDHRSKNEASLAELIEIPVFQKLTDSFSKIIGIAMAILDLEGNVLVRSGWQRICTDFHRKNPLTASRCLESDTLLAGQLSKGQKYNIYQCKNGLIDVATPITIKNIHVGNLYAGQFLFEDPDMNFFEKQAEAFGFDKATYLDAVANVPIFKKSQMKSAIECLESLTVAMGSMGMARKRVFDLNNDLEEQVRERTKKLDAEKKFSESLIRSLPGVMYVFDQFGNIKRWNKNFEKITEYSTAQLKEMNPVDFIVAEDKALVRKAIASVFESGEATVEARFSTASGKAIPFLLTGFEYTLDGIKYLIGVGIDISERVSIENEKANLIRQLKDSLSEVKKLSGLLPICSSCKKIRDDKGYWNQIESYIHEHSEAEFSHGICPDCVKKLYGHENWFSNRKSDA